MTSKISIGQLVTEIASSDATDLDAQADLLAKLNDLSRVAHGYSAPEVGFMLEAATDLMRYLAEGIQPSAQSMLTMVTRLVVNTECCMYRNLAPAETVATERPTVAPQPEAAPHEEPTAGPRQELCLKPAEHLSSPDPKPLGLSQQPALRVGVPGLASKAPAEEDTMKLGAVLPSSSGRILASSSEKETSG
jgi:hypothetical protein